MSLFVLLLLVSGTRAGFYGGAVSYITKDLQGGAYQLIYNYKLDFSSCEELDTWLCGGNCTGQQNVYKIEESSGEWCQKERVVSWEFSFSSFSSYPTGFTYGNWTENINGISKVGGLFYLEMRNRSDINKPNSSPQTTIIPALRVPSNCQRNINLLTFDPDLDDVKCRYANGSLSECITCTPAPVLSVASSCTLSFSPTNSSAEGSYVVQLMMEDFPKQTVTLTNYKGSQEVKTTSDFISKIPLQFVLKVDPAVPSCTEGLYLPRFLPPTPENRAQIIVFVNQMLEIFIRAEATQSIISELLVSGPPGMVKTSSGSGNFTLRWTPSDGDNGQALPVCFVIQANYYSSVYHSEFRCFLLIVGNAPPTTALTFLSASTETTPSVSKYHIIALNAKISTTLSLDKEKDVIVNLIKDELIKQGLPSAITINLKSSGSVKVTTL